jgi:putative membrane-bound dehydrogenase-like protein
MLLSLFLPSVLLCALCGKSPAADFPTPFNTEKGAPMPAEEAAATMQLPPGFKCVVFAAEPDVQQPIAMAWDARGRLWVAENYTYAENPERWNTTLRDRILILEDTDGDGKHDKRKVFWENGTHLTSIENGYGGTWILNAGTLAFLPDKNGDDTPDSEPQILLDGFNTKTIGHNIVNGLRWGPDGWLYGRHGITDTSTIGAPGTPPEKRTKLNCAIWRYHPTRKVFETVAHGGTNSWGHDWNADGELFMINTVIGHLWHVIPGAYYRRMFGTHLNPHVYEIIEQTADHFHWDTGSEKWSDLKKDGLSSKTSELGGGHAHVGMLIYQGGHWPKEYHGAVLTCNLHGNRINVDKLERQGCGYVGKHAPDFMQAKDKWFRGIDLLTGPDGNVFVADWSDSGECHDNDGIHRTSGRIYKIVYEGDSPTRGATGSVALANSDLSAMKDEQLVMLLSHENNWWSRMAAQALIERQSTDPALSHHIQVLSSITSKTISKDSVSSVAATSLQLGRSLAAARLMNFGTVKPEDVKALVAAFDGIGEPAQSVPWIRNIESDMGFLNHDKYQAWVLETFAALAVSSDRSGLVRLHLASSLQRLPLEARWPIATALAQRAEDANDRQQPLMIWYGIEPAVAANPLKGVELIATAKHPTVRRLVARRITELIESHPAATDALVALLNQNPEATPDILSGMSAALEGWSQAPKPKTWDTFTKGARTLLSASNPNAEGTLFIEKLNLIFGSGRPPEELLALITDAEADPNARLSAFTNLTRTPKPDLLLPIRKLINDKILGTPARSALAAYDDKDIPKALLSPWPVRSQEQQQATIATLITRPAYAHALLDAVQSGTVPAATISPYQARQIRSLNDPDLTQKLTTTWGELRDTPEAKKTELAQWTQRLTPELIAQSDPKKGKAIFAASCAACHKLYGEGGALGPELTGSDRHKLSYLLENILDPSAIVPADYRMTLLQLKDGRTLTGVIPAQTDRTLTLQTPAERLTIEKSQITSQQQLPISFMPEGLLTALGQDQVPHLIAYLMSTTPIR